MKIGVSVDDKNRIQVFFLKKKKTIPSISDAIDGFQ